MKKFFVETLLFFSLLWIVLPSNSYGGKYLQLIEDQIKQILTQEDQNDKQNPNDEEKNAILIFTSDGCMPCKLLEKNVLLTDEFKDFIKTNKIDLFTINISQNFKAAEDWGVTNTPAMRFIKYRSNAQAIVLDRRVGYVSKDVIFGLLKKLYNIQAK